MATAREMLKMPDARQILRSLERLGDAWSPRTDQASALNELLDCGLVRSDTNGVRRSYSLTAAGRTAASRL